MAELYVALFDQNGKELDRPGYSRARFRYGIPGGYIEWPNVAEDWGDVKLWRLFCQDGSPTGLVGRINVEGWQSTFCSTMTTTGNAVRLEIGHLLFDNEYSLAYDTDGVSLTIP